MKKRESPEGFAERLQQAMQLRNMQFIELAKKTGCDRKTIYTYVNGISTPNILNAVRMCHALRINLDWLATGNGAMECGEVSE